MIFFFMQYLQSGALNICLPLALATLKMGLGTKNCECRIFSAAILFIEALNGAQQCQTARYFQKKEKIVMNGGKKCEVSVTLEVISITPPDGQRKHKHEIKAISSEMCSFFCSVFIWTWVLEPLYCTGTTGNSLWILQHVRTAEVAKKKLQ